MHLPTTDDAQALYEFILARANEEWEATSNDETLTPEAAARFYRISNSNKLAITAATGYVMDLLKRGYDDEQAARVWDHLTAAGEEWRDNADYQVRWENPQRARIRSAIAGEEG